MVRYQSLICDDEARRAQLRTDNLLNGIDYLEVVTAPPADNQLVLNVFFIPKTTALGRSNLAKMLAAIVNEPSKVRVVGGVRIRNIEVTSVALVGDQLQVRVNEPGDFANYTLVINHLASVGSTEPGLDPPYSQLEFNFKAGCPSRFDCRPDLVCPPEPYPEPLIDYMAKDYASFRQALIDLMPTLVPDWKETHEADLGIALAELLAYAGDQLSYYQDAVANEAYLETARQRVSVRRHAQLIDYHMHDGASARTFVHFNVSAAGVLPEGTPLLTQIDVPLGASMPPYGPVIPPHLANGALDVAGAVFETMTKASLHPLLGMIKIHPWGNLQCCLPRGTITVDLVGDLRADPKVDPPDTWKLKPRDFLLFEEVRGLRTGLAQDSDPAHRQVVRLTKVEKTHDPLANIVITRVTWDRADALTFPLCISKKLDDGTTIADVSVSRGNLVLADHGRRITGEVHPGPQPVDALTPRRAHRFRLDEGPLSFRIPLPSGVMQPVKALLAADPHRAEPRVTLQTAGSTGTGTPDEWKPVVPNLLASDPFDRHFVAEAETDSRTLVRLGLGDFGMAPPGGVDIRATYWVGMGRSGNIGADTLAHVVQRAGAPPLSFIAPVSSAVPRPVRNPLPAWGGIDPEPVERVKQLAPVAFRVDQLRAVTEEDYARAAEKHPEVSKAVATFRWTGSWHTVFLTVDPKGRSDLPLDLQQRIKDWVTRFTQTGYDLEIDPPIFVPLDIELIVCVAPDHFHGDVEQAALAVLSSKTLPTGEQGFFHPDRFTFGQPLYLSELYAAVEAVEGVDSVVVVKFQRFGKLANHELDKGLIPMGRLEVAQLANDRNFPEHGVLRLDIRGGK